MVGETSSSEGEPAPTAALNTPDVAGMLNRADIILTHGGILPGAVIRWFTGSYWDHAAMVFVLSDAASGSPQGYQRTFILEAEWYGIDIHPVGKYLCKENQDMVILRFPGSALPPERRVEFLQRVRGFTLQEIDAVYGYGTILRIAERILGPLGWVLKPLIRAIRVVSSLHRKKAINDFICSGVVQYAYYRACFGEGPEAGEPWDSFFQDAQHRQNLIVNRDMREAFDPDATFHAVSEQLKLTTPADFSLAARAGLLDCVAERVKRVWREELTRE